MGKHFKIKNGDKLRVGETELLVIDSQNTRKILVEVVSTGETLFLRADQLQCKRNSKFYKAEYKPKTKRNPSPVKGQRFFSDNHGECEIVEIYGYLMTIRFLDTGTLKQNVYRAVTYSGKVADPSRGHSQQLKFKQQYAVGKVFESAKYGKFEIVENTSSIDITIRWETTGELQYGISTERIKSGTVVDTNKPSRWWNYLNVDIEKYYIYIVLLKGSIVYVGKGKGDRYLHVNSGKSHNRELNRHYFCHGNDLVVKIHMTFDDKDECEEHEHWMINFLKPCYNVVGISERD